MAENPIAVRSKNNIEAALLALMGEMPYASISITAVAARAGLSRQTFYLNFADKDAVLVRRLTGLFEEMMRRLQTEGVETVERLVATYTAAVAEHADFFRLLAKNQLTGLVCRLYSDRLNERMPVLKCRRENQTGSERRYSNTFWVAAFVDVYALWTLEDMRTSRAEINRILTDIMLGNYFRPTVRVGHGARVQF